MADAIRIAEDSYVTGSLNFAACLARGATGRGKDMVHVRSGARIPAMNASFLLARADDPAPRFDEATDFHVRTASPIWSLVSRDHDADRIAPAAEARGFSAPHDLPSMVLDDIGAAEKPSGLEIETVGDLDGVTLHFRLLAESFGVDFDLVEPVCDAGLVAPGFALFNGRLDGEPVACGLALYAASTLPCVGVYNIGTLPAHRGKGIGRAMTAHAAAHGRDAWGCRVAALQASEAGYPLYRAMGYREVMRWQTWTAPGPG